MHKDHLVFSISVYREPIGEIFGNLFVRETCKIGLTRCGDKRGNPATTPITPPGGGDISSRGPDWGGWLPNYCTICTYHLHMFTSGGIRCRADVLVRRQAQFLAHFSAPSPHPLTCTCSVPSGEGSYGWGRGRGELSS